MSDFIDAFNNKVGKELVCPRCGAANSPTLTYIKVDINGIACCGTCGHGNPYQLFQPKERR